MQAKKRARAVKFGTNLKRNSVPSVEEEHKPISIVEKKIEVAQGDESGPTQKNNENQIPQNKEVESNIEPKIEQVQAELIPESDNAPQQLAPTAIEQPSITETPQTAEEIPTASAQEPEKSSADLISTTGGDDPVVEIVRNKSLLGYFMLIAIVSFIFGLISMAGFNILFQKDKMSAQLPFISTSTTPTPTLKPANTATPTPESVDPAKYSITILNGSGIKGAAGNLKESLTEFGYNVISTGNADGADYIRTTISAKKEVGKIYLENLKNELGKKYLLAPDSNATQPATNEADIIITIGSSTSQ